MFNSSVINTFEDEKYIAQEKGHGRTETRLSMVVHNTDFLGDIALDWEELSPICMVVLIRQEGDKPAETMQIKHYISSVKQTDKVLLESTLEH